MVVYYIVALLAFVALAAALMVRYVLLTVDREFSNLARATTDAEYRRDELAKLDQTLAAALPLPDGLQPNPKPSNGWLRAAPALLFAVGVILIWGGFSAPAAERGLWLASGAAAAAIAAAAMLATLRKRRRERIAWLLRARADLRRLDGDHRGAVDDLGLLLRLTPWDDAAWAELADGEAALGDVGAALRALRRASEIDPLYDDYYAAAAGLATRDGRLDEARRILGDWEERVRDARPAAETRRVAYRAALALAAGDAGEARGLLGKADRLDRDALEAFLDVDEALVPLAEFAARGGKGTENNRKMGT